jgi:WhiB family redox-sensing transcriptional regulator
MRSPLQYEDPVCRGIPWELFFPEGDQQSLMTAYAEAKKACKICPHLYECAEWGMQHEAYGVWGGLSPTERKHLRAIRNVERKRPKGERESCLNQ